MGKIIAFAQQKGGAGKTTLLTQLAVGWTRAGRSVALIDLDPQGSLQRWTATRGEGDLSCIASSDWKASSDMRSAARSHDLVLVDCPGNADILLRATIRDSDVVLAPCQPSAMDVWALPPVIEMAGKERTPIHVVLNRVPPRGGAVEALAAQIEAPVLSTRLGNRVAFSTSFLSGKTAQEVQPRSRAAEEVAALLAELDGVIADV
ncbi:MAG: ParA family partition ATPase [Pseudomonadota bacterium]